MQFEVNRNVNSYGVAYPGSLNEIINAGLKGIVCGLGASVSSPCCPDLFLFELEEFSWGPNCCCDVPGAW